MLIPWQNQKDQIVNLDSTLRRLPGTYAIKRFDDGDLHSLGWCEGPWVLVTPLKAIIVFYLKILILSLLIKFSFFIGLTYFVIRMVLGFKIKLFHHYLRSFKEMAPRYGDSMFKNNFRARLSKWRLLFCDPTGAVISSLLNEKRWFCI